MSSVFVSLGKILNLNLLCWPERVWDLSFVGNITIYVLIGRAHGQLQIVRRYKNADIKTKNTYLSDSKENVSYTMQIIATKA